MLIPARKLVAVAIGSFFLSLLLAPVLAGWIASGSRDDWPWVLAGAFFYLGLFVGLAYLVKRHQVDPATVLGTVPSGKETLRALPLVVPLFALSLGTTYLVYLPLSFVFPGFVDFWLLDPAFPLVQEHGRYPMMINLVLLLLIVALGPFIEELFFRGFLFRRLARKWSFTTAAVLSSVIFALPHPDTLGAFCFGIVMILLYVRSQSLWIPIGVHAATNLFSTALAVVSPTTDTVAEFQSGWPWGLAALVLGGIWFVQLVRRWWPGARDRTAPGR